MHVRTCLRARDLARVTARTRTPLPRVRPCKILSSFTPHRLHLVYPCRDERRQMSESFSSPFSPRSLFLLRSRARVFVGELHNGLPQLSQRPQKEIISDRFYRDGFSAWYAPSIKAVTRSSNVPLRRSRPSRFSSILILPRDGSRIKLAPIFLAVANLLFRDADEQRVPFSSRSSQRS